MRTPLRCLLILSSSTRLAACGEADRSNDANELALECLSSAAQLGGRQLRGRWQGPLPMPSNSGRQVWRTYANSLMINGRNLIPVYSDDTQYPAEALSIWQSVQPGDPRALHQPRPGDL